ncbi:MAG: lipocalin-like domain-containing protein [Muribaculaceae bacterium]|nr:lipocalin-like domain-containing protein [Muribaculaceae bacterium]
MKTKIISKSVILGIIASIISPLYISCQKEPINGNLDGLWEVMSVTPQPQQFVDSRIFYSFYLHTVQLSVFDEVYMNGNMQYDGSTLTMDFPTATPDYDYKIMKQYGIFTNPVTFDVEFPSKGQMILSNASTTVTLRKF